jgi:hypothetical protein
MIELRLECDPSPWVAPTKGRHGFYDKKSKEKELAFWQIKSQYKGPLIIEPVSIEFIFYIAVQKTTSKKDRQLKLTGQILPTTTDHFQLRCLEGNLRRAFACLWYRV